MGTEKVSGFSSAGARALPSRQVNVVFSMLVPKKKIERKKLNGELGSFDKIASRSLRTVSRLSFTGTTTGS